MSSKSQPAALLACMDTLANTDRLRLLRLLERHELGVAELSDVMQLPQSTISRHLKALASAGWLKARKQGTSHLNRLIVEELPQPHGQLWELSREQLSGWPQLKQDELRLTRRLSERQGEARKFFTGAAAEWDKLREQSFGSRFAGEAILRLLPPHYEVADLGCGTGQMLRVLAPVVKRVIGIDNTPAMLAAAQAVAKEFSNVEVREGDLASLPIPDDSCDAAVMSLSLSYLPEPLDALSEMRRILKSNAAAVVVDVTSHDRDDFRRLLGQSRSGFSSRQLTELARAAGFKHCRTDVLPGEEGTRGPSLFVATMRG